MIEVELQQGLKLLEDRRANPGLCSACGHFCACSFHFVLLFAISTVKIDEVKLFMKDKFQFDTPRAETLYCRQSLKLLGGRLRSEAVHRWAAGRALTVMLWKAA